jgi:type IV fimbrial biogenesis protein FimT
MPSSKRKSSVSADQAGLTFIELAITLLLGSVLVAIAVPSFRHIQRDFSLGAVSNQLHSHVMIARNHAITRGTRVALCPRNGDECGGVEDWSNGWLIFEDRNRNNKADDGELILEQYNGDPERISVRYHKTRAYLYYKYDGLGTPNATFRICSTTDMENGKAVVVARNGRPRLPQPGEHSASCESAL